MEKYTQAPHVDDRLDTSDISRFCIGLTYTAPDGSERLFDLYYPETGSGPFPLIINVSGGGWYFGSPSSVHIGRALHRSIGRGYAYASLACTSSRFRKFPYQITELKWAIRHLRRHAGELNLDPEHFYNWSSSAGGHMSLLADLTEGPYFDPGPDDVSCRVKAIAALYPCIKLDAAVEDFTAIGLTPANLRSGPDCAESIFFGRNVEDSPELCRLATPMSHIRSDGPPLLLMHGTADRVVPYTATEEFASAYAAAVGSDSVILRIVDGAGHSDPCFKDDKMCNEILDFFDNVRSGWPVK